MSPVVCFGPNGKYIVSSDYQLFTCSNEENVQVFLEEIKSRFSEKLKIVQVNFSANHESIFSNHKKIFNSAQAHVFILHTYKELSELTTNTLFDLSVLKFTPYLKKTEFIKKVEKIKSFIGQGRLYQVNLTSFLTCENPYQNGLELFLNFSNLFTGQYKAYLPLDGFEILCFSPELFLEKKSNLLRTCPIKGSLGKNKNLKNDLINNSKENSELSMIVDLLRNDFNSLSAKYSAKVVKHRDLLELNYIHHTFSEVIVESPEELPYILSKVLPGGSISGCPKLESLKVIAELEDHDRSFYTGCIGWWKDADFELNLAIRSMAKYKKQLFYFAGCGIVYDSDPHKEWDEFLTKTGRLHVIE